MAGVSEVPAFQTNLKAVHVVRVSGVSRELLLSISARPSQYCDTAPSPACLPGGACDFGACITGVNGNAHLNLTCR